ncbi:MAG TPA: hypothetical protein PKI11_15790 [Candidatus Hydrogenedentes bacterium]|nr:hypothetical protein [Candidatus Hydrogenedentota bacterium]
MIIGEDPFGWRLGIGRGNFFRTTLRRFRLGIDGAVWFRRANLAPADA